jgi:hypothetical protein
MHTSVLIHSHSPVIAQKAAKQVKCSLFFSKLVLNCKSTGPSRSPGKAGGLASSPDVCRGKHDSPADHLLFCTGHGERQLALQRRRRCTEEVGCKKSLENTWEMEELREEGRGDERQGLCRLHRANNNQ